METPRCKTTASVGLFFFFFIFRSQRASSMLLLWLSSTASGTMISKAPLLNNSSFQEKTKECWVCVPSRDTSLSCDHNLSLTLTSWLQML